jgi:hypothetical protein
MDKRKEFMQLLEQASRIALAELERQNREMVRRSPATTEYRSEPRYRSRGLV